MGLIKEMEKSYTEAAEHYDKAFKMSNNKNKSVSPSTKRTSFHLNVNYVFAFIDFNRK